VPSTLASGQLEIAPDTPNALVVGLGTNYTLPNSFVAWWSAPEVRTNDQARGSSDGYVPGLDLLGHKAFTLLVLILANTESEMGDRIDAFKAACAVTPASTVQVRSNLLGRTRTRFGRFRIPGDVQVDEWTIQGNEPAMDGLCRRLVAKGSAQFVVLDGRTYSDAVHTAVTNRATPGSGFTPPFTPPFTLGSSTGGSVDCFNAGNAAVPWSARLDGPLTYPIISHLQSGQTLDLSLSANGGVDIPVGHWVDLSSATRTVLYDGVSDRSSNLTVDSSWWDLAPGDNTFNLAANAGNGTLTVAWRDGYYS